MTQLSTLRNQAMESATSRGHNLRFAAPWHGEYCSRQIGTCTDCGMDVHLTTRPMPNEIDIRGQAVALNCPIRSANRAINGPSNFYDADGKPLYRDRSVY